ncbi:MAG: hypothetical protein AAF382_06550 [Pseudomonadota bacterium]
MGKKIATCCYCGTRAVLVLDETRHELTCSACGAPLHDMKFMPQSPDKKQKKPSKPKVSYAAHAAAGAGLVGQAALAFTAKKSRKKKKRKPMFRRVLEDIFDEIEDIFD